MSRQMFFKQPYLSQILSGEKDLEGRVGYGSIKKIHEGDILLIQGKTPFRVVGINTYSSFNDAVSSENYRRLIPDAKSPADAVAIYEKFYSLEKQKDLGVYILQIAPVDGN